MSIRPFGISVHGQLNRIRNTLRDLEQQVASVHNRLPCAQGISEEEVEQETEIPGAPEESYFLGHVVEDGPLEVPQLLIQRAIDLLPPYIDFPEDRALIGSGVQGIGVGLLWPRTQSTIPWGPCVENSQGIGWFLEDKVLKSRIEPPLIRRPSISSRPWTAEK